jgi:hypothetical protein
VTLLVSRTIWIPRKTEKIVGYILYGLSIVKIGGIIMVPPEDIRSVTEAELYEVMMPGRLVGRAVIDGAARIVGIVRSIRIALPGPRVELIVKGLDVEFPVDVKTVSAVGNVIQLQTVIKDAEVVELNDIARLRKELWEEIRSYVVGK